MKSNCPARGIRYQPKRHHPPHPTKTFTTTGTAKPTATGIPFQGLGNLKVSTLGQGRGCIISHGTWFTSGTCATFRGERIRGLSFLLTQKVSQINPRLLTISLLFTDNTFSLTSSKGPCAFEQDILTCGPHVNKPIEFEVSLDACPFSSSLHAYLYNIDGGWQTRVPRKLDLLCR